MNNISLPVTRYSFLHSVAMILTVLGLLAGCVSPPGHPNWIRVGETTKNDVIERYGPPDMVIASPGGDTAVYRPIASAPRLEIPTAQVGPSGTTVTSMQRIDPGLGTKDLNRGKKELALRPGEWVMFTSCQIGSRRHVRTLEAQVLLVA